MDVVGSFLEPDRTKFRAAVATLIGEVRRAGAVSGTSVDTLITYHNTYTCYCALCLLHATGHRPVLDPFCYRSALDHGIAIIEDKAITEHYVRRPVVLPRVAIQQIGFYEDHLRGLTAKLTRIPALEPISRAINAMRDITDDSPLPWLFLLTEKRTLSLSGGALRGTLQHWPWPLNAGRHMISSGLRALGVPAELVAFELGHILSGTQFCSAGSAWSLAAVEQQLGPALETIAAGWGWQALSGLPASGKPHGPKTPSGVTAIYKHGTLGPESRRAQRARTREEDHELVDEIVRGEIANAPLDQATLDRMAERIRDASQSEPLRLGRRLRFLWNWALRERGDQTALRLPQRVLALLPAAPPFARDFPATLDAARALRERFASHLAAAGRSGRIPTRAERTAEIVLSAALFGGLVKVRQLAALPRLSHKYLFSLGTGVLLEVPATKQAPAWRWVPDDFTAALLNSSYDEKPTDSKAIRLAVTKLLKELDPGFHGSKPLTRIAKLGKAYVRYTMPGFVAASVAGRAMTQSLPKATLVRLLTGVRLAEPKEKRDTYPEAAASLPVVMGGAGLRSEGLELYKKVRHILTDLKKREAIGHKRSHANLKHELASRLRTVLKSAPRSAPVIAKLLMAWGVELAEHGTRWKPRLAFNTVNRYIRAIARPLIESASDLDFLDLEDHDYEAVYAHILNYKRADADEAYLVARLEEFHYFLIHAYGAEPIDWSAASLKGTSTSPHVIDADLLTPTEYEYALMLLGSDPAVDTRARMLTSALLVIGYRYGARVGDIVRLRYNDLEIARDGKSATIQIRTNIYGTPKSDAGIRQIPLIGQLSTVELEVLQTLKHHFDEHIRPRDAIAGLFADPAALRDPIERRLLLDRVHLAMRTASGVPTLHFHHLRHGYGTRLTTSLFADLGGSRTWSAIVHVLSGESQDPGRLRQFLTGQADIRESTLQALPALLGHAAAETTVHHYVHIVDFLAQGIVNRTIPALADFAWSYALGDGRDTVRKRMQIMKKTRRHSAMPPVSPTWPDAVPQLTEPTARGRPPSHLQGALALPERLTLELTDKILVACAERRGNTSRLAERLLISERLLSRVIGTSRHMEPATGWSKAPIADPADWLFFGTNKAFDARLAAKSRCFRGLREWQSRVDELGADKKRAILTGLEAWNSSLRNSHISWFQQRSELEAYLHTLEVLEMPKSAIRAEVHLREGATPAITLTLLHALGIENTRITEDQKHPGVFLKYSLNGTAFGHPVRLSRGLHVLRIMLLTELWPV